MKPLGLKTGVLFSTVFSMSLSAQVSLQVDNNTTNCDVRVTLYAGPPNASGSDCALCSRTACIAATNTQTINITDPACDYVMYAVVCIALPNGNCSDICDCVTFNFGTVGTSCPGGAGPQFLDATSCGGCGTPNPVPVQMIGGVLTIG